MAAVALAAESRVMLVIGETDTGKTHFTTYLASALLSRGDAVAVVDADLGQSDIGPPTTVGLGRVRLPVERLADAEVVGLYFVVAAGFRFALEFIRVNPQVALGLTMAQWMSASVVLTGLVVLARSRSRPHPQHAPTASSGGR